MKTQLWPSTDKSALLRSQFAKLLYGINRIVRLFGGNKNTTILNITCAEFYSRDKKHRKKSSVLQLTNLLKNMETKH